MDKTGRDIFKYMMRPNPNDNINNLCRKEQATIFRLRTGHIQLNGHINRIQPQHPPMCPLCDCAYETVNHHLFDCPALSDIRATLLPWRPDKYNTLYGTTKQLKNTCRYHFLALGRRAEAHRQLDP